MAEGENNPMVGNLRVLDERAFEEFSGRLASLIEEATVSSKNLDNLVTRTRTLSDNASSAKGQLDQRLELSARVLKITKDQLDRVEDALGALNESQEKVDDLSGTLREQLSEFNSHLEEAMEEVDRRVTEAVDGLGSQSRASAQKQARVEQLLEVAQVMGDRFATIEDQLSGGITRFQEGLERALKEIATGNTQAERASSKLDEQVYALKSRVVAFADGIEAWLKPALAEMEAHRQDVERAGEEVRRQFADLSSRVGQALQDIEDRINIGLADFSSRQQSTDRSSEQISASVSDLQSKLAEWTSSLHNQFGQLGTLAADSLRPLVAQLTEHIDASCVSEADLASRLGELQGRMESSVRRIGEDIAGQLADVADRAQGAESSATQMWEKDRALRERVVDGLAEIGRRLAAMDQQLGQGIEQRLESVESRIAEGQGTLDAALEPLRRRIADAIELLAQRQRTEDDAAAHRSQLTDGQAHLREVLGRLEDRLTTALLGLEDRNEADDERVASHLSALKEQLTALGARVESEVSPLLDSLRQRLRDDLETKIIAATEKLDSRVAEILTELEARSRRVEDETTANREQMDRIVSLIDGAVERLDKDVTTPVRAIADQLTAGGAGSAEVEGLKEQLEVTAARLHGEVAGALAELTRRGSEQGEKVAEQVGEVQAKLNEAVAAMDRQVAASLRALDDRAAQQDKELASRIGQLQEHLELVAGRLKNRIEPALAALQPKMGGGSGAEADDDKAATIALLRDAMAQLGGELRQQVKDSIGATIGGHQSAEAEVSEVIDGRLSEIRQELAELGRRFDTLPEGSHAAASESTVGGLSRQLDDIEARLEQALAGGPTAMPSAPAPADGAASAGGGLEQRLNDIQEQLRDTVTQVDCRVAEILAEMGRAPMSAGSGDSGGGGSWTSALSKLEERLKDSMAAMATGSGGDAAGVTPELADSLTALSDQLRTVDRRLSALEPQLGQLAPDGGAAIDVGQIESVIGEVVSKSEQRMLAALAALERKLDDRPAPSGAPAARPAASAEPAPQRSRGAMAAPGAPDAKKLVNALLEAINSGDPHLIRRFVATEYAESSLADRSAEERIEVYMSFHEDAGNLELRHIEKADGNEIVALVQERGNMEWHRLQFQLEPDPPHRILLVNIDAV